MTDDSNRDFSGAVNQSPGMNEREGVEPCPFCTGTEVHRNSDKWGHFYTCECGARGPHGELPHNAATAWNTRAPAPSAWQPEGQPAGWVVKFNDEHCFYWEQAVAEWKASEFEDQHKTKATIEPVFFCPSSDRGGVG